MIRRPLGLERIWTGNMAELGPRELRVSSASIRSRMRPSDPDQRDWECKGSEGIPAKTVGSSDLEALESISKPKITSRLRENDLGDPPLDGHCDLGAFSLAQQSSMHFFGLGNVVSQPYFACDPYFG